MSREFKFPDLGEGITEGELVRWLVKEGDQVKEDQEVAEVETDKALVTIPSPMAGVVEKLGFKEGERVPVGAVFMVFGEEEASAGKKKKPEQETSEKEAEEKELTEKEELAEKKPEPKAVPKEKFPEKKSPEKKVEKKPVPSIPLPKPAKASLPPLATPHTRKIARELGVDLSAVKGSGPGDRITEQDVQDYAEQKGGETQPTTLPVGKTATAPVPAGMDFEKYGSVDRVPLKGIRRKISENMVLAEQQTAMVTHMDEADVGVLLKIQKEKANFAKEKGVKLTLLPFLMKACAIALRDHPSLNASLVGEEIVFKKYYHFGFAVDTEAGLMVPVIRNVDKKSILHLASELSELSQKTRERKVGLEELHGSSFSLTNIGSIGGKAFTPIVNYPDSAILGLGRTYDKPIVKDEEIVIAPILPLCLTFDHRVTDGATGARFINQIIGYLQDPDLLLLEDGED